MKIKLIGKAHMEGTSKRTGKPYNFNVLHYNAPARNVIGEAAQNLIVDPAIYPLAAFDVGAVYDVQFDQRGYVVSIDLVEAP